jgi:phage gp36-like protein
LSYGDVDAAYLQGLSDSTTERQAALDKATAEIDSAIASSPRQYVTPVDLTAITETDGLRDQVTALLDSLAESLAAYQLSRSGAGTGRKVQKDWDAARSFLGAVARGSREIHGLPRRSGQAHVTMVGGHPGDFPDSLFGAADTMFYRG